MNNLYITLLSLVTAATVLIGQHRLAETARTINRQLNQQLATVRVDAEESSRRASALLSDLERRRKELTLVRTEAANAADEAQSIPLEPLDPAGEGVWPVGKPYFYLAKKHLNEIDYPAFTKDQHLSPEAATLFGMTSNEKMAVDASYNAFRDALRELQTNHAERLEPPNGTITENHREVAYRIPALTNAFSALQSEFDSALRSSLGGERAELLLQHASQDLTQAYGQFGTEGYTVRYKADRDNDGEVKHFLRFEKAEHQTVYEYAVPFPLEPGAGLWNYRHLFGEEPLLPLSAKPNSPAPRK